MAWSDTLERTCENIKAYSSEKSLEIQSSVLAIYSVCFKIISPVVFSQSVFICLAWFSVAIDQFPLKSLTFSCMKCTFLWHRKKILYIILINFCLSLVKRSCKLQRSQSYSEADAPTVSATLVPKAARNCCTKRHPHPDLEPRQYRPIVTSLGRVDLPRLSTEHEFNGKLHQKSQWVWRFSSRARGLNIERGIKWYEAIRPDTAWQGRETCSAT
jgi:hypothetical protein